MMTSVLERAVRVFADQDQAMFTRLAVDGALEVYANCSDTFAWGCADAEQVTEDNIDVLEKSYQDLIELDSTAHTGDLFAARVRHLRPQNAAYRVRYVDVSDNERTAKLRDLFDQAGPPRAVDYLNPESRKNV